MSEEKLTWVKYAISPVALVDSETWEETPISLFGAYSSNADRYYQRSAGGVCKECYLYAGTSITSIPTIATKINEHYSIYS